jgi:hypothetical protein
MSDEPIEVQRDLVFGRTDRGEDLTADVYLPSAKGERPAVLPIHGSAWAPLATNTYHQRARDVLLPGAPIVIPVAALVYSVQPGVSAHAQHIVT